MSNGSRPFIPIAAPDIGAEEEAAVLRVLRSGRLAQGPEVAALEEEFARACGVGHVVAVANGTAALHAALHVLGIGPGHEVLIPAFTFAATANAVLAVGATPVFVDIDRDFLIDLADAEAKLTARTAAIMPVHLYGLMVDMSAVATFAGRHGLAVVEDAAQAHLAERGGIHPGERGVAAFSLYATKNMMSGEGGLVATNDDRVAEQLRLFRNHGMPERYRHTQWGLNLRLSDLHAAIGRAQLAKLPKATERRIQNASAFNEGLPEVFAIPTVPEGAKHVFHQYTVRVPASVRDLAVERFHAAGIGVDIYYPTPLTTQPAFAKWSVPCPAAASTAQEVLSLPVHPQVDQAALDRIIDTAHRIVEEVS